MGCSHRNSSTVVVASRPPPGRAGFEPTAVEAKKDRTKIEPHGMRDSVHVDPEHVWGDEGPVNE